jgi:hypothetical protein
MDKNHDPRKCVYAHNLQDFRRKPYQFKYDSNSCNLWDKEKFITDYTEDGCIKGHTCTHSHGWFEHNFHPDSYKTKPCLTTRKCRDKHCPFYHSEKD